MRYPGRAVTIAMLALLGCHPSDSLAGPHLLQEQERPPVDPTPPGTYPRVTHVTFIVDGEPTMVNVRQIHRGPHHVEPIESDDDSWRGIAALEVASVEIVRSPEKEAYGVCPGVGLVLITTRDGEQ